MISSHELYKLNHRINESGIIERKCTKCGIWLEENINNFYMHNKSKPKMGFHAECKKCSVKRSSINQAENHGRRKKYYDKYNNKPEIIQNMRIASDKQRKEGKQAEWQRNNKDKLKIYGKNHRTHDISTMEWISCLNVFNNSCAYCGIHNDKQYELSKQKLHKEHVDDKGYNDLRNAVPACRSCNDKKWVFDMESWFKQQPFFSQEKLDKIVWWTTEGYRDYIEEKPLFKILRKHNDDMKTYHYELWTVDEMRNLVECINSGNKKKDVMPI